MIYKCEECDKRYDSAEVSPYKVIPADPRRMDKLIKAKKSAIMMCANCFQKIVQQMKKSSQQIIPGSRLGI